jgi:hypothetical protein
MEQIGKAIHKERLGGTSCFFIVVDGEPFCHDEIIDIMYKILEAGHYVYIATNGTLTKQFQKFAQFPKEYLKRILFRFSLHYIELVRTNNLDIFFNNIRFIKALGSSYYMHLVFDDSYIPYLDEMKNICLKELNVLPVSAYSRVYINEDKYELSTKLPIEQHRKLGRFFGSELLDYELKYFMVKQKGFCYAGDWANTLNLATGIMEPCWRQNKTYNLFANPEEPVPFEAIGKNCALPYCMASCYYSFGVIPSAKIPTFTELRDQGGFTEEMRYFFGSKLAKTNKEYTMLKKIQVTRKNRKSLENKK